MIRPSLTVISSSPSRTSISMSADVRDILDLEAPSNELTKESVLNNRRKNINEKYSNINIPEMSPTDAHYVFCTPLSVYTE